MNRIARVIGSNGEEKAGRIGHMSTVFSAVRYIELSKEEQGELLSVAADLKPLFPRIWRITID